MERLFPYHFAPTQAHMRLFLASVLVAASCNIQAQERYSEKAFDSCPSKAFLTQGSVPKTYAINLLTGNYVVQAESHGTSSGLNAVGFNPNDRFYYGWSYEHNEPVRVQNDWQLDPLQGVNITDQNFYVGDVDTVSNKYYVYRRGSAYGLYSIGLDPEQDDYQKMQRIIDGSTLDLKIADFAFHPFDGYVYAMESTGDLHRIDAQSGESTLLASGGPTGGFGAAYFDPEGNLYIGRNNDGYIFRINIDSGVFNAELFAIGPIASTNDGGRCAIAPVVDEDNTDIDFGDAPDSYGTSIAANGARHGLLANPNLFLGQSVDGESDGAAYPLSDNTQGDRPDEDGVQFITNIVERETAIVEVSASAPGNLNVWFDLQRDGYFDTEDQILADYPLQAGKQAVYLTVPNGVKEGESWARFRFTSAVGTAAIGGVADGEVEDYPIKMVQNPITISNYPSSSGWAAVAFEDNWPYMGDYDMNDLVVYLRTTQYTSQSGVERVDIRGQIAAVGASYHNGFAIRLPGILRDQVDLNAMEFSLSDQKQVLQSPLEEGVKEAIIIITNDVFDHVAPGETCEYYRTEKGCGSAIEFEFKMSIPMKEPVDVKLEPILDPFLFATPGKWHGPQFATPPGRSYEIHLKNQAPTERFNPALFTKIGNDASDPAAGSYFLTESGLPWALAIANTWDYPMEFKDISNAYPNFKEYVNSNGANSIDWFMPEHANSEHTFKD